MSSDTGLRVPALSAERQALLKARLADRARRQQPAQITSRPRTEPVIFPLSYQQEELWFLHQLAPESPMYNTPVVWRLAGSIDPVRIAAAVSRLVERHEILRTRFVQHDGQPVQIVEPPTPTRLRVRHLPEAADPADHVRLACEVPFDLTSPHRLRTLLLRTSPTDATLLLDLHHIVCDEWSEGVLWRDFDALYRQACGLPAEPLPSLGIQYGDYAQWQRDRLSGPVLDELASFWRGRLAGAGTLPLPTDRPRPRVHTFDGAVHWFDISESSAAAVADLARACRGTPFIGFLAAFVLLLARWAGQDDVTVGTITAGRGNPQLRELVGFFVNTLALRIFTGGQPTFRELIKRTRRTTLDAYAHEELPFSKVVEVVRPRREAGVSPIFQTLYTYTALAPEVSRNLPGAIVTPGGADMPVARFDLVLNLRETSAGVIGAFEYNTAMFTSPTIEQLARRFADLLTEVAASPDVPLPDPASGPAPATTRDGAQHG
jgi:hypothetical protein